MDSVGSAVPSTPATLVTYGDSRERLGDFIIDRLLGVT
jgi:hypothetical protein